MKLDLNIYIQKSQSNLEVSDIEVHRAEMSRCACDIASLDKMILFKRDTKFVLPPGGQILQRSWKG